MSRYSIAVDYDTHKWLTEQAEQAGCTVKEFTRSLVANRARSMDDVADREPAGGDE